MAYQNEELIKKLIANNKMKVPKRLVQEMLDHIAEQDNQINILKTALKESQVWNWLTAHEYMQDNNLDQYPINEMQELHEIAFKE